VHVTAALPPKETPVRLTQLRHIQAQQVPEVSFAWQGGEPTLMGLDFFRRVVELQKQYMPSGSRLVNALQTNGTLLDEEWCRFFHENSFLIGLSLDGPREVHDRYRVDKKGRPTFDAVMRGMELMQQHQVEFNILCVVNRANGARPREVYRFFKEHGVQFLQFILHSGDMGALGFDLDRDGLILVRRDGQAGLEAANSRKHFNMSHLAFPLRF